MRNRAKCKLCESIIESFHSTDYVLCKCGEIGVDGGPQSMRCLAKSFSNFLRVDDEGNEVIIKFVDAPLKEGESVSIQKWMEDEIDRIPDALQPRQPHKAELLDILETMVKRIEELPPQALYASVTHADFGSLLILLSSILRAQ